MPFAFFYFSTFKDAETTLSLQAIRTQGAGQIHPWVLAADP